MKHPRCRKEKVAGGNAINVSRDSFAGEKKLESSRCSAGPREKSKAQGGSRAPLPSENRTGTAAERKDSRKLEEEGSSEPRGR